MSNKEYRYFHPMSGRPLPSVTEIINIINKPGLLPWANSLGFKRIGYNRYMNEVSDLGTKTHEAIHKILCPSEKEETINLTPDIQNPMGGFYNFLNNHNLKMIQGEFPICGDRYGGTLDFIGYLDNIPCIVDFKTSNNFSSSMFLQLVAYENLLKFSNELKDFPVQEKYILKLSKKDYSYQLIPFDKELQVWFTRIFNICLLLFEEWIMNGASNLGGECLE